MNSEVLRRVQAIRDAMDKAGALLTSAQAARLVYLYQPWNPYADVDENGNFIAAHFLVGDRRRFNDVVYECRQEHDAQIQFTPDIIPALWERLDVEHDGTLEDPIPYASGMEVFEGKYYIENDILYLCIRNSEQPLYHNLSNLVGLYVSLV